MPRYVHEGSARHAQSNRQIRAQATTLAEEVAKVQRAVQAILNDRRSWAVDKANARLMLEALTRAARTGVKNVKSAAEAALEVTWRRGLEQADGDVSGEMVRGPVVNRKALDRAIEDTYRDLAGQTENMTERAVTVVRDEGARAVRRAVAMGLNQSTTGSDLIRRLEQEGFTPEEVFQRLQAKLKELKVKNVNQAMKALVDVGKLTAFVDKGGRVWSPKNYAQMVARTVLPRVYAEGNVRRLRQNGSRIGWITRHADHPDALCAPWQGLIVALDRETARELKLIYIGDLPAGGPPFHPNCLHQCLGLVLANVSEEDLRDSQERAVTLRPLLGVKDWQTYKKRAAALGYN